MNQRKATFCHQHKGLSNQLRKRAAVFRAVYELPFRLIVAFRFELISSGESPCSSKRAIGASFDEVVYSLPLAPLRSRTLFPLDTFGVVKPQVSCRLAPSLIASLSPRHAIGACRLVASFAQLGAIVATHFRKSAPAFTKVREEL